MATSRTPNLSEHRFSQRAFRRLEPILRDIALAYPHPLHIQCQSRSPVTLRARLPDAYRSLCHFNWPTDIDRAALDSAFATFTWFPINDDALAFGPPDTPSGPVQRLNKSVSLDSTQQLPVTSAHCRAPVEFARLSGKEQQAVTAFALLFNLNKLVGHVIIDEPDLTHLTQLCDKLPNLAVEQQDDGTVILM